MKIARLFRYQPKWLALTEALSLLGLIGLLDYATGYETSLVLFYSAPILIAVYCCNVWTASVLACLAVVVSSAADVAAGHSYTSSLVYAWELALRTTFFFIIAIAGSKIKGRSRAANTRISLLEHAQRLEHQIVEVSEYEQQRIGQDLHDGLCQYLAALSCSAASLKTDLEKAGLRQFAMVAEELAELLRAGISQTRNLARGLMPAQMEKEGLVPALEELTSSASRLLGVDCVLNCTTNGIPGNTPWARHLYRIAQEAINNATRHGKARHIDVSLSSNPAATVLSVADDGVGISKTAENLHGMGLSIMKYRANLIGGELVVEERSNGGTVVSCTARPEI